MSWKRVRLAVFVFLAVVLAAMPGVIGCGSAKQETGVKEIKYGWLWDFTGRASFGVIQTFNGMKDYLRKTDEEDPIPGVKLELLTYDTRSDASRGMPGYVWLKGQGTDIMSITADIMPSMRAQWEKDQMPQYALSQLVTCMDSDWQVSMYGSPENQVEVIMQWIMDNWQKYPIKPKVGMVALAGVPFYIAQQVVVEKFVADHPGKFDYVGAQMAPTTTTTWAVEIGKLKDCDYTVTAISGPTLASFMMEARNRGYTGTLVGPMESFLAFWSLVKAAVPDQQLDGAMVGTDFPWWNDTGTFMTELKKYAEKYHSTGDLQKIYQGTGEFCGWIVGMILVDALRRAVESVGAENLTGVALLDALKQTNMTVEGWPIPWKMTTKAHVLVRSIRLMQYHASVSDWQVLTNWYTPSSLAD